MSAAIQFQGNRITLAPSEDCGAMFRQALEQVRLSRKPAHIAFSPGRYVFRKKDALPFRQPVTNTLVYDGLEHFRHAGILLEDCRGLTIEGSGAQLVFDGDMTAIAALNCSDLRLEGFSVDYLRPRVSEMTLSDLDGTSAEFSIHPDSRYTVDPSDGFCWVNADGIAEKRPDPQIVQCASPDGRSNLRIPGDPIRGAMSFELLSHSRVRFSYGTPFEGVSGAVYQFRNPVRNEAGIFLHHCRNTVMNGLRHRFTPGLGVVAQLCENLEIINHRHAPADGSGRVCAAFADCLQISSCRGKAVIAESSFSGSQDDPVNIHGTYLGLAKASGRELILKFRHPETWGFLPFETGDEIALVCGKSLRRHELLHVLKAELVDLLTVRLTLERPPAGIYVPDETVVENLSANPDALIENCMFKCYPTRGLLMSSAGKCMVRGCTFLQTAPYSAILTAGDARSWYESGGVRDLRIMGNRFEGCTEPAVAVTPEIYSDSDVPVHRNITVRNNVFSGCSRIWLRCHHAENVTSDIPSGHISAR